jgi:glycosyltransferase involved in cell wall biosynthesis
MATDNSSLVSIILPAFNAGPYLRLAVQSILAQTYTHWELILMDDGSTDDSIATIAMLSDPRIRIFSDGINKGLVTRLNEGVALATGSYIARMDADDVSFPTRFAKQVAFLNQHPNIDLVGCRAVAFKNQGEIIGLLPFGADHQILCKQPWRGIPLPHPSWMGRSQWFKTHCYRLPEVIRAEDQELLLRSYPNSQFACLEEVLYGYRQGPFNLRRTFLARKSLLAAQVSIFKQRGEWHHALLAIILTSVKVVIDVLAAIPGCSSLFFSRMGAPVPSEVQTTLRQCLDLPPNVPKRICFVVSSAFTVNAFLVKPILALAERGWHVTLAVNTSTDEVIEPVRQSSTIVKVDVARPISPLQDLRGLWQLWQLFRRERFDIVHSMTPKAGLLAMLAAWLARVPKRIHTFTGQVWATQQGLMRWLLRGLDKLLASCATALLTDSPSQGKFLVEQGVVSAQRINMLANGSVCGADTKRFAPSSEARQAVRAALDIPADAKVLLFLGRLHPEKGIQELLQAFAKLAEKYADLHLILAGPDEGAAEFIERFAAAGKARIHCIGLTREPERYMAAADIFCLPSYREGFGLSLLEAAATGLPSVASRIYGITDAVVDNVTGLLVPVRDAEALAAALTRLLNDSILCQQLGAAARERAINEFSQEVVINAWLDFYN